MKNMINYIFLVFVFLFIFNINVFAECSYQERKELLNKAKLIDVTIDPKIEIVETTGTTSFSEEPIMLTYEKYSFDFLISNLSEDLFIKYYNDYNEEENYISYSDLKDGLYKFNVEDVSNLMVYFFEIRSQNNNCAGQVFYTKRVTKPIYNFFSEYSICKEDGIKDKQYCKKFINKKLDLTESEFIEKANKDRNTISEEVKEDSFDLLKILKNYWYIPVTIVVLALIIIVFILIRKKRERLV